MPQRTAMDRHIVVLKQRAAIEKLRADNALLKEELLLESKFSVQPSNAALSAVIEQLEHETHSLTSQIQSAYERKAELELEGQELKAAIWEQRQVMGGVNAAVEHDTHMQKVLELQENKLEALCCRVNNALTMGSDLRCKVDNLRREKLAFDGAYSKLERRLAEQKGRMVDLITQYHEQVEAQNKASEELVRVQQRAEREQAALENEWKRLSAIIQHGRKQQEERRAREIVQIEQQTQELMAAAANAGIGGRGGSKAAEPSKQAAMSGGATEGARGGTAGPLTTAERLQQVQAACAAVQQATGAEDLEELAEAFASADERTFSLFSYINDLNGEVDKLEDNIGDLKAEIANLKGAGQADTSYSDKQVQLKLPCPAAVGGMGAMLLMAMQELQSRLCNIEAVANMYDTKYNTVFKAEMQLREGLQQVISSLGYGPTAPPSAQSCGVTEGNLLQALGTLETFTNELLAEFLELVTEATSDKAGQGASDGPSAAMFPNLGALMRADALLQVVPPSALAQGDETDEETDSEPLVETDLLRATVRRALAKKAENAAALSPTSQSSNRKGTKVGRQQQRIGSMRSTHSMSQRRA